MLQLEMVDLEEIALAVQDQTAYEHCWLIDPRSGELVVWTEDGGIDGRIPVELAELDLLPIEPLPSWVWYQDMADFADRISDQRAGRSLLRAIQGKGAFRRFKDRLHENYPHLLPAWHTSQLRPGGHDVSAAARHAPDPGSRLDGRLTGGAGGMR